MADCNDSRVCTRCGKSKPADEFRRSKRYGREQQCKHCRVSAQHEYNARSDVKERVRLRAYRRTPEYRREERRRAAAKRGRQYKPKDENARREAAEAAHARSVGVTLRWWEHAQRQRWFDREAFWRFQAEQTRAYYRKNRSREIERSMFKKRRYRESLRAGNLTEEEIAELRCAKACAYCGRPLAPGQVHVDHVVPLARGGRTEPQNLLPACPRCNNSKAARDVGEWLEEQPHAVRATALAREEVLAAL